MPLAVGLTAEIERELGVRARLVRGDKGIFDVAADGKLVFSKYGVGRFPEPGEVVAALRGAREKG